MRTLYLLSLLFGILLPAFSFANDFSEWRENMKDLVYSPRYFGPSAFPLSELSNGRVKDRFEIEARGQYHYYTGDKTKDLYTRIFIPVVKERVAIEVSAIVVEHYQMTPETRDERHAAETKSPIPYSGDVVISSYYQIMKSKKWVDAMASINLKTASGGRLVDARFTDAASYWFDLTIGKHIIETEDVALSAQILGGFYCWMTNDIVHRQNDAVIYSAGLSGRWKNLTFESNIAGMYGYKNNGDRPIILRNNLTYEIKKNGLSFRYNHGIKDHLYDTYSLGYIRYF